MNARVDSLVASLASVRDADLVGHAELPAASDLFDRIVAAGRPADEGTPWSRPPRRVSRLALPALSLAAAAAVAIALVLATSTNRTQSASAATVLHRAAVVARNQQPLAVGPGQYLYTKSVNAYTDTVADGWMASAGSYTALVPHVRESWLGPGGGRLVETSGAPEFLTARDRGRWAAAGKPGLGTGRSENTLSPVRPLDLPTDPDRLFARLEDDARGHGSGLYTEMFTLVGDSLRETAASPAQRAALYEVAARIPGVELIGAVRDSVGRDGLAVAMTYQGIRHTLIFEPETSALLGEEDVALDGNSFGYAPGTRVGYATYLVQAIVDSKNSRP